MRIKIYPNTLHEVEGQNKHQLCDIFKYWVAKQTGKTQDFPPIFERFEFVAAPEEADLCVLPATCPGYVKLERLDVMWGFIEQVNQVGKAAIGFVTGDFKPHIPYKNVVIFSESLWRSRAKAPQFSLASFATPDFETYLGNPVQFRAKGTKPVIGFCGNAEVTIKDLLTDAVQLFSINARNWAGVSRWEPPPLFPARLFRKRILSRLARSALVQTQFILRNRYWGGATGRSAQLSLENSVRREFIGNLFGTDYNVCVRGMGNFSHRFYETMNAGRIPIFINTDCQLPYDFLVNYKQYTVWIEQHEIPHIAEKVADFHNSLSPQQFTDLQQACRQLWVDRLSLEGFYTHFHEHFPELSSGTVNVGKKESIASL